MAATEEDEKDDKIVITIQPNFENEFIYKTGMSEKEWFKECAEVLCVIAQKEDEKSIETDLGFNSFVSYHTQNNSMCGDHGSVLHKLNPIDFTNENMESTKKIIIGLLDKVPLRDSGVTLKSIEDKLKLVYTIDFVGKEPDAPKFRVWLERRIQAQRDEIAISMGEENKQVDLQSNRIKYESELREFSVIGDQPEIEAYKKILKRKYFFHDLEKILKEEQTANWHELVEACVEVIPLITATTSLLIADDTNRWGLAAFLLALFCLVCKCSTRVYTSIFEKPFIKKILVVSTYVCLVLASAIIAVEIPKLKAKTN